MHCLGFQCIRTDPLKSHPFSGALSVCDDYCDNLPETWCVDWVSDPDIPSWPTSAAAQAMISECTLMLGKTWEWPSIITDLAWARSLQRRWGKAAGCRLVALACDDEDVAQMVAATRPPAQQPGFAAMGELGHYVMAQRTGAFDPTWPVIGWEVLEANSALLADCHTDVSRADPVTGLLPDLAAARSLVATLQQSPTKTGYVLIPMAIIDIPEEDSP